MSFSGTVKEELASQIGAARHCRIAELSALISFGTGDGRALEESRPEAAEKVDRLLQLQIGRAHV